MNTDRFDGLMLSVAQQMDGGIDQLLELFFGFLHRKTDFYSGAINSQAQKIVMDKFLKFKVLHDQQKKEAESDDEEEVEEITASNKIEELSEEAAEKLEKKLEKKKKKAEKTPAKAAEAPKEQQQKKKKTAPLPEPIGNKTVVDYKPHATDVDQLCGEDSGDEDAEGGKAPNGKLRPNTGNGANLPNYIWIQTLSDLEIRIPFDVPFRVKGKDCVVEIKKNSLTVGLKGHEPVLKGALPHDIHPDESTWLLDSNTVTISLEKVNQMEWWANVVDTEPEINTRKIQPENSNVSDLDDETQGMVRKMMFDQRQKEQGLPSSDELKKHEMLEKFKKAHPEMDFSNVKMG